MKAVDYPGPIRELVRQLRRLPGIGPRGAERIAMWVVRTPDARPGEIADALLAVRDGVRACTRCGFFSEGKLCAICADEGRESAALCVVEHATDILPLERSGAFRGRYHTLGGRLSPLDGVGPENLAIEPLVARVREESPVEVILALGADVEGEATAQYVAERLMGMGCRITRIAQGLPAGGGLDHADELTLRRALSGRREVG